MKRVVIAMSMVATGLARADDAPPPRDEPSAAEVESAPVPGTESGRTDPADHDSVLRDIGQGALFVPRVAVEVALSPVRASVWALDRFQLVDRFKRIFFDDSETYGLYPTLVLDQSYGLTVGGRFVHRNLFGEHEHLALRAGTGGEYRAQASAGVRSGERFGERTQLELRGEFERRPADAFYGIGNTEGSMVAYHREELFRASTRVDMRAISALHVRAAAALTDIAYADSSDGPPIEMIYTTSSLTGWPGTRNLYGELELRWDSRRVSTPFAGHHVIDAGSLLAVYAGPVHPLDGGVDYWRYGGEAQQFLQLGAGPRALATRLYAEGVTGATQDIAFTQLPELGGKTHLRGYPRDRFRDRFAAVGSLEYLWDLGNYPMASLFIDVGRVFPSPRDIEPTNLRVGYGFSLQLHDVRRFIASVSIASSIDGGVFFNLAFDPVFDIEPRVEDR